MQHATADIAVHQQCALSCVRERERQISRQERLAVARSGTRDRDEQRARTVLVREAEAHTAQSFDDLGGVLGSQMRHSADDRQPEVARDLFRVPHAGIRAVEQDRAQHTQSEAGQKPHEQQAWRRVLDWTLRHHRRVENPDIRNGGFSGEPGLIEALL